jgi:hypothetical protein
MKIIGKSSVQIRQEETEDPMSGVANLFDISVVLIVCMLFALFSALNMMDLFNPGADATYMKQLENGEMQIITKKGKEIKVQKVTRKSMEGRGTRLGTAFQLENGKVVYVPDE